MTFQRTGHVLFAFAAIIGATNIVYADNAKQLLHATSDAFSGALDLKLEVDADNVATKFEYVAPDSTEEFGLDQLPSGLVLLHQSNYDVVIVKSADFDPANGGTFELTYLYNGLSGTYDNLTLELSRQGDTWELLVDDQSGRHAVSEGYFKSNRVFGKAVGIEKITLK